MKPLFHPQMVNGNFEDPVLFVDFLFERRALMFDLGDISALPAKKILRLSHVFISHTHMDHFIGFDHLLRICLGRDRNLALFGPPGLLIRSNTNSTPTPGTCCKITITISRSSLMRFMKPEACTRQSFAVRTGSGVRTWELNRPVMA